MRLLRKYNTIFFIALVFIFLNGDAHSDIPSDFHLVFSRGGCFGACPAYTVQLFSDGRILYKGNLNVRLKGQDSSFAPKTIVSQLFNDSKVFLSSDIDTVYGEGWKISNGEGVIITDGEQTYISITLNGITKHINYYLPNPTAPKELGTLEKEIDSLLQTKKWTNMPAIKHTKNVPPVRNIWISSGTYFNRKMYIGLNSDREVSLRGVNNKGDTSKIMYIASEELASHLFDKATIILNHYKSLPKDQTIYPDSQIVSFTHCPKICISLYTGNSPAQAVGNIDTCYPPYQDYIQFAKEIDSALNTTHLNILPFDKY